MLKFATSGKGSIIKIKEYVTVELAIYIFVKEDFI